MWLRFQDDSHLDRLKIDWRWRHSIFESGHVGSASLRHWFQKRNGLPSELPLNLISHVTMKSFCNRIKLERKWQLPVWIYQNFTFTSFIGSLLPAVPSIRCSIFMHIRIGRTRSRPISGFECRCLIFPAKICPRVETMRRNGTKTAIFRRRAC